MVHLRSEGHGLLAHMQMRYAGLMQLLFSRLNDGMALPRTVHLREALCAGRLCFALVLLSEEAICLLVLVLLVHATVVIVYVHPGVVVARCAATNSSGVLRQFCTTVAIVQQGALDVVGPPLCFQEKSPVRRICIPFGSPVWHGDSKGFSHGVDGLLKGGFHPQAVVAEVAHVGQWSNGGCHLLTTTFLASRACLG